MVADSIQTAVLGAWFRGAGEVARIVPPYEPEPGQQAGKPPGGPPPSTPGAADVPEPGRGPTAFLELTGVDAAFANLKNRALLRSDDYYELDAKAKANAFTITTQLSEESDQMFREKVHAILTETAEQPSFGRFRRAVLDAFDSLPISEAHLEQVYRNNINESYAQGQEHVLENPLVADEFPYRAYYAIHDGRVDDEHLAMETLGLNGTNIYHKDDPTWIRFRPPWRFNCRCSWSPVTIADAARAGVKEAAEWLANIRAVEKAGGSRFQDGVEPPHYPVKPPPFKPDPKWERNNNAIGA